MIISFEGLDKSGKASSVRHAKDYLENLGYKVKTYSFPQYETKIGQLIRGWLTGKEHFSADTFELLQAADKLAIAEDLKNYKKEYDFVLIDRYIHSQLIYGEIDNDGDWVASLIKNAVQPDAVIYLDNDVDESQRRQGEHGDNDKYEADYQRLVKVKEGYDNLLKNDMKTYVVDARQPLANELDDVIEVLNLILH